jgi:hypothetical protein
MPLPPPTTTAAALGSEFLAWDSSEGVTADDDKDIDACPCRTANCNGAAKILCPGAAAGLAIRKAAKRSMALVLVLVLVLGLLPLLLTEDIVAELLHD